MSSLRAVTTSPGAGPGTPATAQASSGRRVADEVPPWGRLVRAAAGLALVGLAVANWGLSAWDIAAAAVVLPTLAIVVFAARARWLSRLARGHGEPRNTRREAAWGTLLTFGLVLGVGTLLTFTTPVDGQAMYVFVGISMVLAAVMGYPGCEVDAVPRLLLGAEQTTWCPVYSPLDGLGRRRAGPPGGQIR